MTGKFQTTYVTVADFVKEYPEYLNILKKLIAIPYEEWITLKELKEYAGLHNPTHGKQYWDWMSFWRMCKTCKIIELEYIDLNETRVSVVASNGKYLMKRIVRMVEA